MRPVVVTAVLLLVVLMSMSASAAWNPDLMCRTKYPVEYCRKDVGPGWYQYGPKRCVKAFIHNKHLSQSDALKACQKFEGGILVSIYSIVELCKVECAMYRETTRKAHYWIGLYRKGNNFIWIDWAGSTKFTHWARWQPDDPWWKHEYCVEMNYGGWGRWNDANCGLKRPYVCEVRL